LHLEGLRWSILSVRIPRFDAAFSTPTRVATREMTMKKAAGQGLAEYALILALIAIAAVVALLYLSGAITSILSLIGQSL
jgi:pilus assembly protein Flp/PilA